VKVAEEIRPQQGHLRGEEEDDRGDDCTPQPPVPGFRVAPTLDREVQQQEGRDRGQSDGPQKVDRGSPPWWVGPWELNTK
jgi:hypothetical protein